MKYDLFILILDKNSVFVSNEVDFRTIISRYVHNNSTVMVISANNSLERIIAGAAPDSLTCIPKLANKKVEADNIDKVIAWIIEARCNREADRKNTQAIGVFVDFDISRHGELLTGLKTRKEVTVLEADAIKQELSTKTEFDGHVLIKGALVSFGRYKWRVLYVNESTALLITEEITDIGIPYNSAVNLGGVSWEDCSLRKWLNHDFLQRFSQEQRNSIVLSKIIPESNPWFFTTAGNPTLDKVFLLSISDVIRYFGDSGHLRTRPENLWVYKPDGLSYAIDDNYNAARKARYKGDYSWWWLRSPGDSKAKAAYINLDGIIFLNGELSFDDGGTSCVGIRPGVRPAIWLRQ